MAQFTNMYPVDLADGHAAVVSLNQMYLGNAYANRVGAIVTDHEENVALGGSCAGTAVLADGSTVALTGTVSGNEIYCDLPSGAYAVNGPIEVFITWVSGENKTTLLAGFGNVRRTETGAYIDPGTIISDVAALIESINTAVASIPADYSALLAAVAPTFDPASATGYAAGTYVWYSGVLYRFTADHAAGTAWSGTDAAPVTVGGEIHGLKSALNSLDGAISDLGIFVQSTNIFDGIYTADKMLDSSGNLVDTSGYGTTGFIPVVPEKTVYFGYVNSQQYQSLGVVSVARYAFYDKFKGLIPPVNTSAWVSSVEVPDNAMYMRVTISNNQYNRGFEAAYDALPTVYSAYVPEYWEPKDHADVLQNASDIDDLEDAVDDTNDKIDVFIGDSTTIDIAANGMFETATVNDAAKGYIGFKTVSKSQDRDYRNKRIVAVNHDDLQPSDYLATRKIYNKYGFRASFNFILLPFADAAQQASMIANVKRLVADGHDLGLHAIMGASYWWMNPLWDLRPNFTTTYAPIKSELQTVVADGKNVFGYTVGAATKFENIGFANVPSSVSNVLVTEATEADYVTLMAEYVLHSATRTITGLDLDGNSQTWRALKWLEYWYNELIDNTLGYSTIGSGTLAQYVADYAVPSGTAESGTAYSAYIPDAAHLSTGKVVRFDDTTNPHYSDSNYQKVGYFTKGLFRGCMTGCNYEVIDRCIEVAKAFCKHYFGIDKFTNFGRHGVLYASCWWRDANSVPYDNRDKTILTGEVGRFYHSRTGKFTTEHEILLNNGIQMTNHSNPLNPIFESQVGLYYGQSGVRYPFFNHVNKGSGDIDYLAFFGTSSSAISETMDYNTFISYMGGRDDWLKFAYEKAGQTFTKPDGTGSMHMFNKIKQTLDHIKSCFDTGKIPVFSWDTIKLNAATMAAVELVCQYCYANNIEIVPMEYARRMATDNAREYRQNWFPNPKFTQSLLTMFGGSSIAHDAYMPDGWFTEYIIGDAEYTVSDETINGNTERALTITTSDGGILYLHSRVYGLPAGTYKFSAWMRRPYTNSKLNIFAKKNSDYLSQYYGDGTTKFTALATINPTDEWAKYEQTIIIPEPYQALPSDSVAGQYGKGYENNVSNLVFEFLINARSGGNEISIALPKLEKVS